MSRDARTCRSYRSLLIEYLTGRTRSGKHFLDAQKYATAALEYLCGEKPSKCSIIHSRFLTLTGMTQPESAKGRRILSDQPSIGHDIYPPSLARSCKNRQVHEFCEKPAPFA